MHSPGGSIGTGSSKAFSVRVVARGPVMPKRACKFRPLRGVSDPRLTQCGTGRGQSLYRAAPRSNHQPCRRIGPSAYGTQYQATNTIQPTISATAMRGQQRWYH